MRAHRTRKGGINECVVAAGHGRALPQRLRKRESRGNQLVHAPLRLCARWLGPPTAVADWLSPGRGGALVDGRPSRDSQSFPPCRSWRVLFLLARGGAVRLPQALRLGPGIPTTLRGTAGVRAKATETRDATKWPATCGQSSRPGRRRRLRGPRHTPGSGTGRRSCRISATASSRRRRPSEPRLGGGPSKPFPFSVRCCSPSSSLSFLPSPT